MLSLPKDHEVISVVEIRKLQTCVLAVAPDGLGAEQAKRVEEARLRAEIARWMRETAAAAVQDQDESGIQGSQISDFHSSANRIDCFNTVNVATKNLTLILKLLIAETLPKAELVLAVAVVARPVDAFGNCFQLLAS